MTEMPKADSLRQDAATLEREAKRLDRKAARAATRNLCMTAAELSETAYLHRREAAALRLSAYSHED